MAAWTTPAHRAVGWLISAAVWNAELIDNLTHLYDRLGAVEEETRTVRGRVWLDGTIYGGTGFTVEHPSTGLYHITFAEPFWSIPHVSVTLLSYIGFAQVSGDGGEIQIQIYNSAGTQQDNQFSFCAQAFA